MRTKTDSPLLIDRRGLLTALGAFGGALLVGCKTDAGSTVDASSGSDSTTAGACAETPEETAGPYPDIDGMISDPAFYRSDVREDRTGLTLALKLKIVDAANACAAISGANVEIWHCDAGGVYSEYANSMNPGSTTTTFLRGVQTTDADGYVTFTTIYPGWYQGRATHIHIQVYNGTTVVKTTQLAFPDATNTEVYGGGSSYYTSGENPTTNAQDMVFSDGDEYELATVDGSIADGYTASLQVGVTGYA